MHCEGSFYSFLFSRLFQNTGVFLISLISSWSSFCTVPFFPVVLLFVCFLFLLVWVFNFFVVFFGLVCFCFFALFLCFSLE